MRNHRHKFLLAVFLSVALHALALIGVGSDALRLTDKLDTHKTNKEVLLMEVVQPLPQKIAPQPVQKALAPRPAPALQAPQHNAVTAPVSEHQPASMEAPRAPTAEEWAFAAQYTLKNSKGYRHSWGTQVRSMMGTAVEGPDQGVVRFRVEIAPDGTLSKLETLWSTSPVAEQLARKAIENMPPLPPTPNGKLLVFEKTISFSPFTSDSTPLYRDDCLPDPPTFRNPFAWNGKTEQVRVETPAAQQPSPQDLEACLKQLPRDSIEAESAHDQRQLEQWRSTKLGR